MIMIMIMIMNGGASREDVSGYPSVFSFQR